MGTTRPTMKVTASSPAMVAIRPNSGAAIRPARDIFRRIRQFTPASAAYFST